MATAKVVNYTAEQTAELKAAYLAAPNGETVKFWAEKLGRTTRSIVAKLVTEKVYQKAEYTDKNGQKPIKKDETANAIGAILKLSDGETDSLAKANKSAIGKVFHALANSVPIEQETPEEIASKSELLAVLTRVAGLTGDDVKSLSRVRASVLAKLAAVFADEEPGE